MKKKAFFATDLSKGKERGKKWRRIILNDALSDNVTDYHSDECILMLQKNILLSSLVSLYSRFID